MSREGNEWEVVLGNESSSQWSKSYVWIEWEEPKDNWPKFRTGQSKNFVGRGIETQITFGQSRVA